MSDNDASQPPAVLPHDALVKTTLAPVEHARGFFRSVLPPALTERLDLSTLSLEPTNYVGRWLGQLYTDLFYAVRFRDGEPAALHLAFEHESTNARRLLPVRFLRAKSYFLERWSRDHEDAEQVPAVIPVLLHHGRAPWTGATAYRDVVALSPANRALVEPYVTDFRILLIDLQAYFTDWELWEQAFGHSTTEVCRLALMMLQHAPDNPDLIPFMRERTLHLWRQVLTAPSGMDAFMSTVRYIQAVNDYLDTDEMRSFIVDVAGPEAEELVMGKTIGELKQQWRAEAHAEGHTEGHGRGRVEGRAETLLKQIQLRFGPPSEAVADRVRNASTDDLERWTEGILTARTLAELLGDDR